MVGIPRPPGAYQSDSVVDSTSILDDAVGAVDVSNTLVYDMDNKSAVVGADLVLIADSAAANINKEATITAVMELAAGTVGTSSLENTAGVLKVDIANTTAATEPTTADKVLVSVSGVNKSVTIQNLAKPVGEVFAATNATSALSETDGVGRVNIGQVTAKAAPVGADMLLIEDTVAPDANKNKMCTITQLAETLAGTVTDSGIENTAGVLAVVPASLTAATPVGGDAFLFADANGTPANVARKVTLTNLMDVVAGTETSTGLTDATGVLTASLGYTEAVVDVTNDDFVFRDHNDSHAPKTEAIADLVTGIAGSAATSGLTASGGVLAVAARLVNQYADEASSLFFISGEVNQQAATAVDYKITDSMPAKGKLLVAFLSVTEAANGDNATVVVTVSKAATGATPMCGTFTITKADTVYTNLVGNCLMAMPVTGADAIQSATGDVYVYCPANTSKTTGKVFVFLVFQVTA